MDYDKKLQMLKDVPGSFSAPRFMLDRDQVFYSKAFRRLAGKAQVFLADRSEHTRNRLTHTLEVSQIARSIAQSLDLDLDLVEAIALGHDLGHTPFGHAGERILHEIMTPSENHILGGNCPLQADPKAFPQELYRFLGFKHNLQGIVVAMELEKNYKGRGLNLTEHTLYGIQAHSSAKYKAKRMKNHDMLGYYEAYLDKGCKLEGRWAWSLEALLVAQADEIAQYHHDMEDALLDGLITPKEMVDLMDPLLKHCHRPLNQDEQAVLKAPESCDPDMFIYLFTRIVVELLMTRLAEAAAVHIAAIGETKAVPLQAYNPGQNRKKAHIFTKPHEAGEEAIQDIFSFGGGAMSDFAKVVKEFSDQITPRIIASPDVRKADADGQETICNIFRRCYEDPRCLPEESLYAFFDQYHGLKDEESLKDYFRPEFQRMSEAQLRAQAGQSVREKFEELFRDRNQTTVVEELLLMRTICNYIACMTDSGARKTWQSLNS